MRAMTKKLLVLIMIAVLSLSATFATANFDLDVDDDGKTEALTDGLLVIRYLFGFSGESLVAGAVSNNASRSTAADIEAYLKANLNVNSKNIEKYSRSALTKSLSTILLNIK